LPKKAPDLRGGFLNGNILPLVKMAIHIMYLNVIFQKSLRLEDVAINDVDKIKEAIRPLDDICINAGGVLLRQEINTTGASFSGTSSYLVGTNYIENSVRFSDRILRTDVTTLRGDSALLERLHEFYGDEPGKAEGARWGHTQD